MIEKICNTLNCTGCGMCADLCPAKAISMQEMQRGFVYPVIDSLLCVECGLCQKKCPANQSKMVDVNVLETFAAWNKDKRIRHQSTSGGVFSLLAKSILAQNGIVVGAVWDDSNYPRHIIIEQEDALSELRGSKYSQSNCEGIYKKVKYSLDKGRKVLFSGTPCQVASLKSFVGGHENLYLIDLVCHGVPSNRTLGKYYSEFNKRIVDIKLRSKEPYWDYCYVNIMFEDGSQYKSLTVDDPYFNLFNIGYTLRPSCHECRYACLNRESDITLADFWGYMPSNFKMRDYNKGTSLVLANSNKGKELFEKIEKELVYEKASLQIAISGNKSLKEPYRLPESVLNGFWKDYEDGLSLRELNSKYCAKRFSVPNYITLRRIYYKWKWLFKR